MTKFFSVRIIAGLFLAYFITFLCEIVMLSQPVCSARPINPQHMQWLENAIYALVLMNGVDAILTVGWVTFGLAVEANPLMDGLLQTHPVLFMIAKLSLVFLGITLLWRHRKKPMVIWSVVGLITVYYLLMLIHAHGIGLAVAHAM